MRTLHWSILKALPGPFLGWMGIFMFLLLMQFLMRYLPDIAGRGLPFLVITELVVYNLAYMVVLAVPMSVLLATLMVFGQLSESNSYAVIKSSGISLPQLLWPLVFVGLVLVGSMAYFNHYVLPEANFRARVLWQDIRQQKPGFELQPGVFYDEIQNYTILVQDSSPETDELHDITIYDYTEGSRQQAIIKATSGTISSSADGAYIILELEDGEVHRKPSTRASGVRERYERLEFDRYRMQLDVSDFGFERSEPQERFRSERTMPTATMIHLVDSLESAAVTERERIVERTQLVGRPGEDYEADLQTTGEMEDELPATTQAAAAPHLAETEEDEEEGPSQRPALRELTYRQQQYVVDHAREQARSLRSRIEDTRRSSNWDEQRASRYRVEIHKKFSIAVACLIFIFIGAPLGLSVGRGGLGVVGALSFGIFMFYWVTLVQGEKFANRGLIDPWVGMWVANILMTLLGVWLLIYVSLDLKATPPLRRRVLEWLRGLWRG